jgi:predicted anti-sigma-YlaC factor YlaD
MRSNVHASNDRDKPRHPPPFRLDAVAAGDDDEQVSQHLLSCETCTQYVRALREQAAAFRAQNEPAVFVARASAAARRRTRAEQRARAAWIVAPLVAAAAVLLVVRERPEGHAPTPVEPPASLDLHFKGGVTAVVIRERDGQQERLAGPLHVRAGDRIRLEVSTDETQPLTAGLLTDEGAWVPLLASSMVARGTHYSELAARFDDTPTRATLLLGTPSAVDQAKRTRDFTGLLAWRLTSEP